jgi:hypothetical protein
MLETESAEQDHISDLGKFLTSTEDAGQRNTAGAEEIPLDTEATPGANPNPGRRPHHTVVGARISEVAYQANEWRMSHPDQPMPDGKVFTQPMGDRHQSRYAVTDDRPPRCSPRRPAAVAADAPRRVDVRRRFGGGTPFRCGWGLPASHGLQCFLTAHAQSVTEPGESGNGRE